MTEPSDFRRARFIPQTGRFRGEEIVVHFNPVSLEYTVSNTLDKGQGNDTKQYVSQTTGKLSMELIFDTTHNGEDVRIYTEKVAGFMEPDEEKIPPVVLFEWGTYKFQGMVESYKETIDFFAPNGVPLRAVVSLSMAKQDQVFERTAGQSSADTKGRLQLDAVEVPPGALLDAAGVGNRAGNPRAARSVAADNDLETLRFPGSSPITVAPTARPAPTPGLADDLLPGPVQPKRPTRLDVQRLAGSLSPPNPAAGLPAITSAGFLVGGQVARQASASLGADVGTTDSLRSRLQFEE